MALSNDPSHAIDGRCIVLQIQDDIRVEIHMLKYMQQVRCIVLQIRNEIYVEIHDEIHAMGERAWSGIVPKQCSSL